MIEDVVPNSYSRDRSANGYRTVDEQIVEEDYPSTPPEDYQVSSAPAFGSPSNRRESYVESPYGYQVYLYLCNIYILYYTLILNSIIMFTEKWLSVVNK